MTKCLHDGVALRKQDVTLKGKNEVYSEIIIKTNTLIILLSYVYILLTYK